ncbi:MAG: HPF/RaiA family ribosome-associated protein [Minisyncoccia bacterium]
MNITIKATNHSLTEANRSLIEEKLDALRKFTNGNTTALLAFEVAESMDVVRAGGKYRAEGTLSMNGQVYRSEAIGDSLEIAVDRVRDELSRKVRSYRGRAQRLFRRGGGAIKSMLRGFRS